MTKLGSVKISDLSSPSPAPAPAPAPNSGNGMVIPPMQLPKLPAGYACFTSGNCGLANGQGRYCLYQRWEDFVADSRNVFQSGINLSNYSDISTGVCPNQGSNVPLDPSAGCEPFSSNRWVLVQIDGRNELVSLNFDFGMAGPPGATINNYSISLNDPDKRYVISKFEPGVYTCQTNRVWRQDRREVIQVIDRGSSRTRLSAGFHCFTSGSCGYADGRGYYCLFSNWDSFFAASKGQYLSKVDLGRYVDTSTGVCR